MLASHNNNSCLIITLKNFTSKVYLGMLIESLRTYPKLSCRNSSHFSWKEKSGEEVQFSDEREMETKKEEAVNLG